MTLLMPNPGWTRGDLTLSHPTATKKALKLPCSSAKTINQAGLLQLLFWGSLQWQDFGLRALHQPRQQQAWALERHFTHLHAASLSWDGDGWKADVSILHLYYSPADLLWSSHELQLAKRNEIKSQRQDECLWETTPGFLSLVLPGTVSPRKQAVLLDPSSQCLCSAPSPQPSHGTSANPTCKEPCR